MLFSWLLVGGLGKVMCSYLSSYLLLLFSLKFFSPVPQFGSWMEICGKTRPLIAVLTDVHCPKFEAAAPCKVILIKPLSIDVQ